MPRHRHVIRLAVAGWLLFALLIGVMGQGNTVRAEPATQNQTVPRTPPATWTPVPEPAPATPVPATPAPTSVPAASGSAPLQMTGAADEGADLTPGGGATVRFGLTTPDGQTLQDPTITVMAPVGMRFIGATTNSGQVTVEETRVVWMPGTLPGGSSSAELTIETEINDDVLPGATFTFQPVVTWSGGEYTVDAIVLALPAAVLPEAGL